MDGVTIKKFRKFADLSRREFGLRIGVSEDRIVRLEKGYCLPRPHELERITAVLGLTAVRQPGVASVQGSGNIEAE
jgi:transcriptional regulator with XRE-family HTH domain